MLVVGVDVGSVRRSGGFSWAALDEEPSHGQDDPTVLAQLVVDHMRSGGRVALAFECPLTVPVPDGRHWLDLGRARTGEGNRPWSAGAGTGALATGLVQVAWTCKYIVDRVPNLGRVTTQLEQFADGSAQLLLTEAMVTDEGKPEPVDGLQDQADATAAAHRLEEIVATWRSTSVSDVRCQPHAAFNLAAAAALHAEMRIDPAELRMEIVVAKSKPAKLAESS